MKRDTVLFKAYSMSLTLTISACGEPPTAPSSGPPPPPDSPPEAPATPTPIRVTTSTIDENLDRDGYDVVEAGIVGRQAASRYLNSLASIGLLDERREGREVLFIHRGLLDVLADEGPRPTRSLNWSMRASWQTGIRVRRP